MRELQDDFNSSHVSWRPPHCRPSVIFLSTNRVFARQKRRLIRTETWLHLSKSNVMSGNNAPLLTHGRPANEC